MFTQVGTFDYLATRGVPPPGATIESTDLPSVREFIDVILVSAFPLAKHTPGKLRPGGSITFTSGISKDRPSVLGGAVVAAVAGSFGYLARALALVRYSTGLSPAFRTTRTASLKCFPAQHANANLGVALSTHFEKLRS
jgi:hypothetical protein